MHVDFIFDSFVILRLVLFLFCMNKNYLHINYWSPPVDKNMGSKQPNAYDEALLHVGGNPATMPLIPWEHGTN